MVFALWLMAAAGCRSAPRESLHLGRPLIPSFGLLYVAEDEGLITEEGLDLTVSDFPSGRDALKAALDGKLDFATVYSTPLLHQLFAGRDVVAVTTLHRATAATGVVAHPASGIRTSADLRGKQLGVTAGTSADFVLDILLAEAGLTRADVKLMNGEQAVLVKQLTEGALDGAVLWQQHLLGARRMGSLGTALLTSDAYTEVSLLAGTRPRLAHKRSALILLLRALAKAERVIDANPNAITVSLKKRFPDLSEEDLQGLRRQTRFEVGVSNLAMSMLQQEAGWLERQGMVRAPEARVQNLLSADPLEEVAPEAVTLLQAYLPEGETP